METLVTSRQRILKTIADGDTVLAHATATRMIGAHTLAPAPRDPVRHLEEGYVRARRHLARLTVHDPSREVPAFMTEELFSRLTDAQPAPSQVPSAASIGAVLMAITSLTSPPACECARSHNASRCFALALASTMRMARPLRG